MPLPAEDPKPGVPDWIVTYGDMMSLLLTFFVLLAAFSKLKTEEDKLTLVEAFANEFGTTEEIAEYIASVRLSATRLPKGEDTSAEMPPLSLRARATLGSRGVPGKEQKTTAIREGKRQVIGLPVSFMPGDATLSIPAKLSLRRIADELRGKRLIIDVEATMPVDPLPAGSRFIRKTQLCYARARAAVEFLVAEGELARETIRLSVAAGAESDALTAAERVPGALDRVYVTALEASASDYQLGRPARK